MLDFFNLFQQSLCLQVLHDLLARLIAVQTIIRSSVFVDRGILVQDIDHLQVMPLAHFEVIDVMRRGDL